MLMLTTFDSIAHLAADANINDIIITVDFNFNQAKVRVPPPPTPPPPGDKTVKILLVEFLLLKFTNKPHVFAAVI